MKWQVGVDYARDKKITDFGKATLKDRYMLEHERSPQHIFARVASQYADNQEHADRLYQYMSNLWFMPATPVLSNGGTNRGLPISCFLNEVNDSLSEIMGTWNENVSLASKGGGIGTYWGNLRGIGERINGNGKCDGVIPFIKVQDSLSMSVSQGGLRKGSAAVYLPVWHPEIEEFLAIRRPTGGDPNRKSLNLHHGVVIDDAFMKAVEEGSEYNLISAKTGHTIASVDARTLWADILLSRVETGEPYMLFIDTVNKLRPVTPQLLDLRVKTSNLCSEITLPTGKDHLGEDRTAVCCLSSLNLEYYDFWSKNGQFYEDIYRFLDNVLQDFIDRAPKGFEKAVYSAMRERSVGLGVMGLHSYMQLHGIPFESPMAIGVNNRIFNEIHSMSKAINIKLAMEKGPCPDAVDAGTACRFSHCTAVAPTASISIICGGSSPGVEPFAANTFTHKTLSGSFAVRNKHLDKIIRGKMQELVMADSQYNWTKEYNRIWSAITTNEGSIQNMPEFTEKEKRVFKTAKEIDQRWIIDLAGDRAPLIDQAQSVNVFLPPDVHKKYLSDLHYRAWKKGLKSLYYCRSNSSQRADIPSQQWAQDVKYEDCLACQ